MSQIIPVPVQLNVETSSEQYELSVSEQNIPISFQIGTAIVASTIPTFEGPYEVEPSASVQTLDTEGFVMGQNVTVDAIPADYVGPDVPRRTSPDLTASGPTVTAPAGYYEQPASADVAAGRARTPNATITANPTISIDGNGLITATVSKSRSITPTVTAGYVSGGVAGTITASGEKTLQLDTQAGATITPTESEQTAVAAQKFTTGDVKVGAIPSDYVGSGIDRRDSSNLTASGKTVTAPAGYYQDAATKDVADGVRGNRVNTIGYSGTKKTYKISYPDATSGYYAAAIVKDPGQFELERQQETVTPTESAQEVTPTNGLYYLEKVTVNPIPTDYGKIEQNGSVLTIS